MAQVEELFVFLASPGDVPSERRYVQAVVDELNHTIDPARHLVLQVKSWENDTFPGYGMDAQALINAQIGEMAKYSVFVGIMWNRLGTPTPRSESGTVEEFERAVAAWAQHRQPDIWFYFCQAPAKLDTEEQLEQRKKVLAFEKQVRQHGLPFSYKTPSDFRSKFHGHMMRWLNSRTREAETSLGKERSLDLTGDWIVDDGNWKYDARLKQVGDRVSGGYDLHDGTGTIDGLVEGNLLKLSWDQPFNQRGGEAKLEILSDGQTMMGRWNYDPTKYNSGLQGGGAWNFRKWQR